MNPEVFVDPLTSLVAGQKFNVYATPGRKPQYSFGTDGNVSVAQSAKSLKKKMPGQIRNLVYFFVDHFFYLGKVVVV